MIRSGIQVDIPAVGALDIRTVCSDFTGTLSVGGQLVVGVASRLRKLAKLVDIHVVTSDTNNTAKRALRGLPVTLHRIESDKPHHEYKRDYLLQQDFEPRHVAVLGNGRNDRLWLELVKRAGGLAIAVDVGERAPSRRSIVRTSLFRASRTRSTCCFTLTERRRRCGPEAALDVRFTYESGQTADIAQRPSCARRRHTQRSKLPPIRSARQPPTENAVSGPLRPLEFSP